MGEVTLVVDFENPEYPDSRAKWVVDGSNQQKLRELVEALEQQDGKVTITPGADPDADRSSIDELMAEYFPDGYAPLGLIADPNTPIRDS